MLYGLLRPDSGRILVYGKETHFHSPRNAMAAKIAMVHQEFMLINSMTVVENVAVMQDEELETSPRKTRETGKRDQRCFETKWASR